MKIGHFLTDKWSIVFLPNLTAAVFGSLLLFPIYNLSKKILKNHYYALLTTATVLINPIIWRWSEIAMSDIFALFFILYAIVFFIDFVEKDKNKYLWLSSLFLYLSLMTRVLYGLIIAPLAVYWLVNHRKELNFKRILTLSGGWLAAIFLMIFTYGLFNDYNFFSFLSNYGSVMPTFKEFIASSLIILKSVGFPMFLTSGLGLIYLFKKNRKYFYFILSLLAVFFIYLAGWYRYGWFDIERYSIFLTVILLIVAGYCLIVNKITRILFVISLLISLSLFARGINLPLSQYKTYGITYGFSENYFINYEAKASQLSLQTKIDGDLRTYQDLADYINDQDIVFYWHKDWAMSKLSLAGANLSKKALLVSIESKEDLEEKLDKYQDKRIYLLRGAYDTYLEIMEKYRPVESIILKNRSIINFILLNRIDL